jgi:hypothetical protein
VYGCAVAGISVTRPGTAPSMPTREEVDELIAAGVLGCWGAGVLEYWVMG